MMKRNSCQCYFQNLWQRGCFSGLIGGNIDVCAAACRDNRTEDAFMQGDCLLLDIDGIQREKNIF